MRRGLIIHDIMMTVLQVLSKSCIFMVLILQKYELRLAIMSQACNSTRLHLMQLQATEPVTRGYITQIAHLAMPMYLQ